MRPEHLTNIESLLHSVRRTDGGFSALKQQDTAAGFASLLLGGAPAGADDGGLQSALPMLPAGASLPASGKPLPEGQGPAAVPLTKRSPEVDAGDAPGTLALMLEAGNARPAIGNADALAIAGHPAAGSPVPQAGPEDKPADMPAADAAAILARLPGPAEPAIPASAATADTARNAPVAGPVVPPALNRPPEPSKRALPALASGPAETAEAALQADPERPISNAPGGPRVALPESLPASAPIPDAAASLSDAATRSGREALAPVPLAPLPARTGPSDSRPTRLSSGDALQAVERLSAAPAIGDAGPQATSPLRGAEPASPASTALARDTIYVPVQDPAWDTALSERVVTMSRDQRHSAEIRLSPADLGPLRVQLSVEDGKADVTFHVQHGTTREAIEQALPRLRDMLAENGLQLGRCDVGDAGTQDRAAGRDARPTPTAAPGNAEVDNDDPGAQVSAERTARGLIDTFA